MNNTLQQMLPTSRVYLCNYINIIFSSILIYSSIACPLSIRYIVWIMWQSSSRCEQLSTTQIPSYYLPRETHCLDVCTSWKSDRSLHCLLLLAWGRGTVTLLSSLGFLSSQAGPSTDWILVLPLPVSLHLSGSCRVDHFYGGLKNSGSIYRLDYIWWVATDASAWLNFALQSRSSGFQGQGLFML